MLCNLNVVALCRYGEYIRESAWFKAKWGGDFEGVMQDLKDRFDGYQWHPLQAPGSAVYNPWAVLHVLRGGMSPYPWCRTAQASKLLDTVTLNAPAILATTSCPWGDLTTSLSPRAVGSSTEWRKVGRLE